MSDPAQEIKYKNREEVYVDRNHLSNISEERSGVHNISSIRSSQMINYVKPNQPKCFICKHPQNEEQNEEILPKNQNLLIYPCLCNNQAHRLCIKQWITINSAVSCSVCKSDYAVGKAASSLLKNITQQHLTECLKRFSVFFFVVFLLTLLIAYIATIDINNSVSVWRVILVVLFLIVVVLIIIYALVMLLNSVHEINIYDIELYCNQTEIAYHRPNSRDVLKGYLERMAPIEDDAGTSVEIEIKSHKHDTDAATNISLLGKKKKLREEINNALGDEERNQTLSRILANDSDNYINNEEEKKMDNKGESANAYSRPPPAKSKYSKGSINIVNSARNYKEELSMGEGIQIPKFQSKNKENKSLTISSIQVGEFKGEPSQSIYSKISSKVFKGKEAPVDHTANVLSPAEEELPMANRDTDEENFSSSPKNIETKEVPQKGNLWTHQHQHETVQSIRRSSYKDPAKPSLSINTIPEPKNKNMELKNT